MAVKYVSVVALIASANRSSIEEAAMDINRRDAAKCLNHAYADDIMPHHFWPVIS